jgi:hypothetical protein
LLKGSEEEVEKRRKKRRLHNVFLLGARSVAGPQEQGREGRREGEAKGKRQVFVCVMSEEPEQNCKKDCWDMKRFFRWYMNLGLSTYVYGICYAE